MALRTIREIENQLSKALGWCYSDKTDFQGNTYEEGVEAALRWALGQSEDEPIETEFSETQD